MSWFSLFAKAKSIDVDMTPKRSWVSVYPHGFWFVAQDGRFLSEQETWQVMTLPPRPAERPTFVLIVGDRTDEVIRAQPWDLPTDFGSYS